MKKQTSNLKRHFFTGILVTAPISITLYLAIELIRFIDNSVTKMIPDAYNPQHYFKYGVPFLGVSLLIVVFVLIGMITERFLGGTIAKFLTKLISKIPFVSGVYSALQKIFETLLGQGKETAFRQAVLIEYPRKEVWTIAFITGTPFEQVEKLTKEKDLVTVYVPTTPNPTSGFMLYVQKSSIIPLDMPVEEAFKIVLSTGIISPDNKKHIEKKKKNTL